MYICIILERPFKMKYHRITNETFHNSVGAFFLLYVIIFSKYKFDQFCFIDIDFHNAIKTRDIRYKG